MRFLVKNEDKPMIPIAPMIDCVFLLLIYFMVTSSLERQEADLSFSLPASASHHKAIDIPREQLVVVDNFGQVFVNSYPYDSPSDLVYRDLTALLCRFKEECEANKVQCSIRISPSAFTTHQVIIRVMDAVSRARITELSFVEL